MVVASGCGTRAHNAAVAVAERFTTAHGYAGKVTCSNGIGGMHTRTPDFICDVRVSDTACDQLEARHYGKPAVWHVTIRRRGVDCVLPA